MTKLSIPHNSYVFVGDGYTAVEMSKWQADAQKVINGFLADPAEPFADLSLP